MGTARDSWDDMRRLLRARGLVPAALVGLVLIAGCNTGAIAIKQCREIENARCEASAACGVIDDVAACQRFYRDQCLHGIAGPKEPTADTEKRCVDMIEGAGECAQSDPNLSSVPCFSTPESGAGGMGGTSSSGPSLPDSSPDVCSVIANPWDFPPCAFLNPAPGAGGEGG